RTATWIKRAELLGFQPRGVEQRELLVARVELLLHDRHRQAARISLAGKQSEQAPHRHLTFERTHRPQLPPYQLPRGLLFLLGVELLERISRQLIVHPTPAKLLRQRTFPQPAPTMPR